MTPQPSPGWPRSGGGGRPGGPPESALARAGQTANARILASPSFRAQPWGPSPPALPAQRRLSPRRLPWLQPGWAENSVPSSASGTVDLHRRRSRALTPNTSPGLASPSPSLRQTQGPHRLYRPSWPSHPLPLADAGGRGGPALLPPGHDSRKEGLWAPGFSVRWGPGTLPGPALSAGG